MFIKTYSKKQAGVVYAAVKRGDVIMSKTAISIMYDIVGGVDVFNTSQLDGIDRVKYAVKNAVDAIFAGDMELAQSCVDNIAA